MADPEVKILRDEMAKIIAEVKKCHDVISELQDMVEDRDQVISEMRLELDGAKRKLAYYENPHSPPSQNSFSTIKKKSKNKIPKEHHKKPGGKPGHVGASHNRKSTRTEFHSPEKCECCGGSNLTPTNERSKQSLDIEFIPQAKVVTHVTHDAICIDCRHSTCQKDPGIVGTSLGPNAATIMMMLWEAKCSNESTRKFLKMFGITLSKSTMVNAYSAIGKMMEAEAQSIALEVGNSDYVMMDETPYRGPDGTGYTWTCIGNDSVCIVAASTRSSIVIEQNFPYFDVPLVCDGYPGYNGFSTRQRCWAHILREAEDISKIGQQEKQLHENLQKLLHDAKLAPPDKKICDMLEIRARSIAQMYSEAGHKFGHTLANAASYLFTFVMVPGMPPTNNESERALRSVVIHRKIRQWIASVEGMRMFGVMLTCLQTWRKKGLDVAVQLQRVLGAT